MEESTKRDLKKLQDRFNEDLYNEVLLNLIENSSQYVSYFGEDYIFDTFHYDGVLLLKLTWEYRAIYVAKWFVQDIKIL